MNKATYRQASEINSKNASELNYSCWKTNNRSSEPPPHPFYSSLTKEPNSSNQSQEMFKINSFEENDYVHQNSYQELAMTRSRSKSLQFRGNFKVEETENGIKIQIKQPHLICVRVKHNENNDEDDLSISNENPININKTSIRIYPLKVGRTKIGSCSNSDIQIQGIGIEPEHCFIESNQIFLNDKTAYQETESFFIVTIYPIAKLCAVDGVLIDKSLVLNTG